MTKRSPSARRGPAAPADPFGLLVETYQSNAFLLDALERARRGLASARAYLASPGCNRRLGEARVLRLDTRRRAALTLLRANRIRVRDLVGSAA